MTRSGKLVAGVPALIVVLVYVLLASGPCRPRPLHPAALAFRLHGR